MLGTLWSVFTLPFRLVARAVELLGRLTALIIGFTLMVLGVALGAGGGGLSLLGIPVFVVGLVLTLRALG